MANYDVGRVTLRGGSLLVFRLVHTAGWVDIGQWKNCFKIQMKGASLSHVFTLQLGLLLFDNHPS